MESCSSFVTRKVSVLNLFFNTSELFINRFTLVCYGFKCIKPYFKKTMVLICKTIFQRASMQAMVLICKTIFQKASK